MNKIQDMKVIAVTPPAAIVDNAAFSTTEVDAEGYRYVSYIISLGATDIAMTALKATASDTAGSGHTDISGADFSVSPATLPSATDDNLVFAIHIDRRQIGGKRYIDLTANAGDGTTGTYASVIAILSNAEVSPNTAAEQGYSQALIA